MSQTTQQEMFNNFVKHQAYLYRLSSSEITILLDQFNQISNSMVSQLRDLLDDLSDAEKSALMSAQYTTSSLREVKNTIQSWRTQILNVLPEAFAVSAAALAVHEAVHQAQVLGEKITKPNTKTFYNDIKKQPMPGGVLLDHLFLKTANDAKDNVEAAIRDGIGQGQTNQQIVQRIKGKKTLNYQDGILQQSRSNITTMVRTARSHVANQAMLDTYRALDVMYIKFVATLDSRTSARCASLDGEVYKIGEWHPLPPLHPNCRSILVPVLDESGKTIGKRPLNSKLDDSGEISTIDSNISFKKWFSEQSEDFQKSWLGPTRYELYKSGRYSIDKFIDPLSGKKFTLDELRKLDQQSFESVFQYKKDSKSFSQPNNELSIYELPKRVHKPDISTPARSKAVKYEDELRGNKSEYGIFIDKAGKTILTLSGDANSVGIPKKYWHVVENSTFTHNHPAGSNFSVDDIITAAELNLMEVRAVTGQMRFMMAKDGPSALWPKESEIRQALRELNPKALDLTKNMVNSDMINLRHAQYELEHQLWVLVAKRFGLKYKREKS